MNKKPNILLLVADQHRGDWIPYSDETMLRLGTKDLPFMMPNVKKMMDEGTAFTNCTTPSPLCAPARACLAAGLDYRHAGVSDNGDNYPANQKTFYSVLKEAGYSVGGTGKFDLTKPNLYWGLDGWVDDLGKMGFTHAIDNEGKLDGYNSGQKQPKGPYWKYLHDNNLQDIHIQDFNRRQKDKHDTEATKLPEEAYCDNWILQNTIDMIKGFDKDNPWFLQVNFTGPHGPWDITESMKRNWENTEFPQPADNDTLSKEKLNAIRQNYGAMINNIDRNIKLIADEVKSRGEIDNTIIIYTADHGEMMGDKNLFGKIVPYRGSVSIPLIVWGKSIRHAETDMLCQLHDLAATIVDFCGLEMPEAKDSISLKPYLTGESDKDIRDEVVSELNEWKMTADKNTKKIFKNGVLAEEYDLNKDIWETTDINY